MCIRDRVWVPNTAASRWIWELSSGQPTNVTLDFRVTFDLTGLNPATASLNGSWSTDNLGNDIRINGTSTGQTCGGFTAYCNFSIGLDFIVQDLGVIAGFRTDAIRGSAQTSGVPEPLNFALVGVGLAALTAFRRWRQ